MEHGWTKHGHSCCRDASLSLASRPQMIARCGGPVLCDKCARDAAAIHFVDERGQVFEQARRDAIGAAVTDMVADLMYYDRKSDEELPVGAIDEAIRVGAMSVDEIAQLFRSELVKNLEKYSR